MMDNQTRSDRLAAVAVALLLILTAWGNAVVMLAVAGLGLVAGMIFFGRGFIKGGALSAFLAFVLAVAIALVTLLS
jgi:hypothetical protein